MEKQDLYGLPLDRFIPERNALVRALRAEGRRDEAASAAESRKPSVAAWTVNQVARTQRRALAALFEAGDALERAQSEVLAGRADPGALAQAAERERRAVGELVEKARGLLSADGHELTQATLDRVSDTLHAAALDRSARTDVEAGCLLRELRHIGLGAFDETAVSSSGATGRRRAEPSPGRERRGPKDRGRPRPAERARSTRVKAARQAELEARRRKDRAAREVRVAVEQRTRAADALARAEGTLATAQESADRAAREHQSAQRALDEL